MEIPQGLYLEKKIISEDYEKEIIKWLDLQTWSNELSRHKGHASENDIRRGVQSLSFHWCDFCTALWIHLQLQEF